MYEIGAANWTGYSHNTVMTSNHDPPILINNPAAGQHQTNGYKKAVIGSAAEASSPRILGHLHRVKHGRVQAKARHAH